MTVAARLHRTLGEVLELTEEELALWLAFFDMEREERE